MTEGQKKIEETLDKFREDLAAAEEMGMEFMWQTMIDYGSKLGEFPEGGMCEENKIYGCQSVVYVATEAKKGRVFFTGYAESQIVRGQLHILIEALSGRKATDVIYNADDAVSRFVEETDVISSLTPSRANAFGSIFEHMKKTAAEKCLDSPQQVRVPESGQK